jgi:8-hydroxy-5-deazaflavin:NADPH oxidoreductase
MRIGVLGAGAVGRTLASGWVGLGHDVVLGARSPDHPAALEWAAGAGEAGRAGTYVDAVAHGELVVVCLPGEAVLDVLGDVGPERFSGLVVVDVTNPLDFSGGFPDSLAERVQRLLPEARVVKALNTVNADVMVNPTQLPEPTDVFVCGDDNEAKATVRTLLVEFGWQAERVRDLGGIASARGVEMYLPLWLGLMSVLGGPAFNIRVVR